VKGENALDSQQMTTSEESLTKQGTDLYPKVLAAIGEFERLVWQKCKEVVESERAELLPVAGILSKQFDRLRDPANLATARGTYAALLIRTKFSAGRRHAFALWWEDEKLYAAVWAEFQKGENARRALEGLHSVIPNASAEIGISDGCLVWMRLEVPQGETHRPWGHLTKCIRTWCDAWRRVPGGMVS
jgi:hypothetical protein